MNAGSFEDFFLIETVENVVENRASSNVSMERISKTNLEQNV